MYKEIDYMRTFMYKIAHKTNLQKLADYREYEKEFFSKINKWYYDNMLVRKIWDDEWQYYFVSNKGESYVFYDIKFGYESLYQTKEMKLLLAPYKSTTIKEWNDKY